MGSALRSGDAIVVRSVPARALEVGDIVTLPDPTSARGSITHRIVGRTLQGQEVGVVTKGDASRGSERWSLDPEHRVGRFLFRVPALGHVAGFVSLPWTRAGVIAALLILMVRAGGAKRPSGHRLT